MTSPREGSVSVDEGVEVHRPEARHEVPSGDGVGGLATWQGPVVAGRDVEEQTCVGVMGIDPRREVSQSAIPSGLSQCEQFLLRQAEASGEDGRREARAAARVKLAAIVEVEAARSAAVGVEGK